MAENMQNDVKGRDVSRPMDRLELGGKEYPLAFDLNAFRISEDIYELQYGRDLNFAEILKHLAAGKIGAIMCVLYGAMISGGAEMKWGDFIHAFRLTSIPGMKDKLMENIGKALPEVNGNADPQ